MVVGVVVPFVCFPDLTTHSAATFPMCSVEVAIINTEACRIRGEGVTHSKGNPEKKVLMLASDRHAMESHDMSYAQ